jgi:hypothetical protein
MTDKPVPLPFEGMEKVYDRLAAAIDRAGPECETLFLTRLVMILAHRAGEGVDFADCIAAAHEPGPAREQPPAPG